MAVRRDLAAALELVAGADVSVFAEAPTGPPALPALIVTPGTPYRVRASSSGGPACLETWRLRIEAAVPIDAVDKLDRLDALADVVRDVIAPMAGARYLGVADAPLERTVSAKPAYVALVDVELTG